MSNTKFRGTPQDARRPMCSYCGEKASLRCNSTSNGYEQYGWYCLSCKRWAVRGKPFIGRWDAAFVVQKYGKTLADVPIIGEKGNEVCAICGAPNTELHHFAPQEYRDSFDNWQEWPTAYLCPKHHTQWHELVQGRKIR